MIFRNFLCWVKNAPEQKRILAVGALTRSYLHAGLNDQTRSEAEAALTFMLDDTSIPVRRALAEFVAKEQGAPIHVVSSLICDEDEVALPVLEKSVDVSDLILIDTVAVATIERQCAIAKRAPLTAAVSGALCEVGSVEACGVLLQNEHAHITASSFIRVIERFGEEPIIQTSLLDRGDVPKLVEHDLLREYAGSLKEHPMVKMEGFSEDPEHMVADAKDRVSLAFARKLEGQELGLFVEHLRKRGYLTGLLLLRAAAIGQMSFLEVALSALSKVPQNRICKMLPKPDHTVFAVVLRKATVPARIRPLIVSLLHLWGKKSAPKLSHKGKACLVLETLLDSEEVSELADLGDLHGLLSSIYIEVSRQKAKETAHGMLEAA
ncbi:DUF2336 domain-containing protein [Flexibacterium corallicola]|uniref:DUF2336 domain-containing protein n=1 Tax=Flexibacterium corallicola TaxID=3037259 RepID=UPI00286FAD8B|nr:DUF2336 domain-containing protein [Pseudovibrio sp. M1P-2-3]